MTNYIQVLPGKEIDLGKRGEHLARCIVFDISDWQKTYGEGNAHLLHQRNGDTLPYPCVVETDGAFVRWLLSETDVDVAGRGRAELQYFVDEARVKSETWNTRTHRSMNNEGPIPEEPAENWLNTMLELGTQTQENAEVAEQSAEIAKRSAEMAKNSEEYVAGAVESAVAEVLDEIQASVDTATESAEAARTSCEEAQESAVAAEAHSLSAIEAERAAKDAQTAAEQARDEAQNIVGADFATTSYVDSKVEVAESNAMSYTDQKIAEIPPPDVSGEINKHDAEPSAHADIRKLIDDLTAEDVGAAFSDLSNVSDSDMLAKIEASGFTVPSAVSKFVTGTYTGNGAASQTISLGFTPKAVFVVHLGGRWITGANSTQGSGAMAIQQANAYLYNTTLLSIVTNGFCVYSGSAGWNGRTYYAETNQSTYVFNYIAFA